MDGGQLVDAPKLAAETPILVVLDGPTAHDEVDSLYEWVCSVPDIRRHALINKVGSAPRADGMGVHLDAVAFVVDAGFQTAGLLLALASWREARRARASITLHRDGRPPLPLPLPLPLPPAATRPEEPEDDTRHLGDPA
jgi:hypothetical protein